MTGVLIAYHTSLFSSILSRVKPRNSPGKVVSNSNPWPFYRPSLYSHQPWNPLWPGSNCGIPRMTHALVVVSHFGQQSTRNFRILHFWTIHTPHTTVFERCVASCVALNPKILDFRPPLYTIGLTAWCRLFQKLLKFMLAHLAKSTLDPTGFQLGNDLGSSDSHRVFVVLENFNIVVQGGCGDRATLAYPC